MRIKVLLVVFIFLLSVSFLSQSVTAQTTGTCEGTYDFICPNTARDDCVSVKYTGSDGNNYNCELSDDDCRGDEYVECGDTDNATTCSNMPGCNWTEEESNQNNEDVCVGVSQGECGNLEQCEWSSDTFQTVTNWDFWQTGYCSDYDVTLECPTGYTQIGQSYNTNNIREISCIGTTNSGCPPGTKEVSVSGLSNPQYTCSYEEFALDCEREFCQLKDDPIVEGVCVDPNTGQINEGAHHIENIGCCEASNLGNISEDGNYVCLKNRPNGEIDMNTTRIVYSDNSEYIWRKADTHYYQIMAAQEEISTHFVSTGFEWYMCDATNTAAINQDRLIEEYSSYISSDVLSIDDNLCSSVLKYALGSQSVGNCQLGSLDACRSEFLSFDAFCIASGVDASFNEGEFMNSCGNNCYFVESGTPVSVEDHYRNVDNIDYCNSFEMAFEPECMVSDDSPSVNCWQYPTHPECKGLDLSQSCQQIQTTAGFTFNSAKNICQQDTTCISGDVVINNAGDMCCIGASARCLEDEEITSCEYVGVVKPLDGDHSCSTLSKTIGSDQCCIGGDWLPSRNPNENIPKNTSFICYNQLENNYVAECCFGPDCVQTDNNRINPLGKPSMPAITGTSVLTGGSLHELYFKGTGEIINLKPNQQRSIGTLNNDLVLRDWSSFEELRFFIWSQIPNSIDIVITDTSSSVILNAPLSNYYQRLIGPFETTEVRIPVTNNFNSVGAINFVHTGAVNNNIIVDRLHLYSSHSVSNSKTMYCTGKFREWVDNFDGPDGAIGFWESENPSYQDYAPYEQACDAQPSYLWTGRACCGNNPDPGEYFIDTRGMCWDSVPVRNNRIVKKEVGLVDNSNETQKLLYSNGKIYGCNITAEDSLIDRTMTFGEGVTRDSLASEDNFESRGAFNVMQGYVCMPDEGWVDLADSNRMLIMASHLLNLVEDDYTLYCGDIMEVANYLPEHITSQPDLTQRACILRQGTSNVPEQTWVGLELNTILEVEEYADMVLKPFMPFSNSEVVCPAGNVNTPYVSCSGLSPLHMYGSDILGIVLISDKAINNANLVDLNGWQTLVNWVRDLLNINIQGDDLPPELGVVSKSIDDLYIAKKDGSEVRGTISGLDEQKATRITIKGLNPQLGTLELLNLFSVLPEENECVVDVKGNNEVEVFIPGEFSNWKRTTGILRIQSEPQADTLSNIQIGTHDCSDFSKTTINLAADLPSSEPDNPSSRSSAGSVYFEDFESATVNQNFFGSNYLTIKNNENNNHLQARYKPNSIGSPRIFHQENIPPSQDYTLKYHVYFDENFEFVKGGKLPGLTSNHAVWGCWDDTADHGWSVRAMWRADGVPEIYYYDNDREAGDCGKSILANNFQFQKGQWYDVSLRVKVNDNGQSNGEVELRIDNALVASKNDISLRAENSERSLINKFAFNTFFGGRDSTWAPSTDVYAYFDNFLIE